jgi:hypothetical protein
MNNFFNIELPPYPYLVQVINNHPLAAATYVEIWRQRDKENKITIEKNEIRNKFLIAPTKFRNDLYQLVREGLANVHESWDKEKKDWHKIDIELVDFGRDEYE